MFKKPIPKLGPEDIEVKVKQVTAKGAVVLLYKTARTDMRILDMCAGVENWKDRYQEIKGNLYCTIEIRNSETGEWISRTDCGTESREDGEGNEKKGEASDAFKRAGFKWGIGRELYTAPFIFLTVPTQKNGSRYELVNKFSRFTVKSINYEGDCIKSVVIVDDKGKQVYPRIKGGKEDICIEPAKVKMLEDLALKYEVPIEKVLEAVNNQFGTTVTSFAQFSLQQFTFASKVFEKKQAKVVVTAQ